MFAKYNHEKDQAQYALCDWCGAKIVRDVLLDSQGVVVFFNDFALNVSCLSFCCSSFLIPSNMK